jgi:hypothetical protein
VFAIECSIESRSGAATSFGTDGYWLHFPLVLCALALSVSAGVDRLAQWQHANANYLSVARVISQVLLLKSTFLVDRGFALSHMMAESLGVSTQVMVTGLILFHLAKTWMTISAACPSLKRSPMYSGVAAIVIESATPIALFGGLYITVTSIVYLRMPENLIRRGAFNVLREVFHSMYYTFYVSEITVCLFE